jgi:hypothetical protein
MVTLTWTDEAQRWLRDIFDYIAADNPLAAARTVDGIYERRKSLATFPRSAIATLLPLETSGSCSTVTIESPISSNPTKASTFSVSSTAHWTSSASASDAHNISLNWPAGAAQRFEPATSAAASYFSRYALLA